MNKKKNKLIDIHQILTDYQNIKGEKELKSRAFWSPYFGCCYVNLPKEDNRIWAYIGENFIILDRYGYASQDGLCMIFPSKSQRDWEKFKQEELQPSEKKPSEAKPSVKPIHRDFGRFGAGDIVVNSYNGEMGMALYPVKEKSVVVVTPHKGFVQFDDYYHASKDEGAIFKEELAKICSFDDAIANMIRIYAPKFMESINESKMFKPFEKILSVAEVHGKYRWLPGFYGFYDPERNQHVLLAAQFSNPCNDRITDASSFTKLSKNIPIIKYNEKLVYKEVKGFSPYKIDD